MNKIVKTFMGFIVGFINGLLGSGGGMISVPLLKKIGLDTKSAHASSIAVILPLSIISTLFYSIKGTIDWKISLILIVPGILGAIAGIYLFKKISNTALKKIFGIMLIISSVRMLLN